LGSRVVTAGACTSLGSQRRKIQSDPRSRKLKMLKENNKVTHFGATEQEILAC